MSREEAFLERVRAWFRGGLVAEPTRWLDGHGLAAVLPDLFGETEARAWGRRTLTDNLILLQEAGRVLGALREAGIPAVALKGVDLLERLYGGREGHRRTADMDVLVDRRELGRALELVEGLGYRYGGREAREAQMRWAAEVEYDGPRNVRLEVHYELLLDTGFDATWEELDRARLIERGAGPGGSDRLTLEALTVHLLVHMAKHRFGGDSLRWILDLFVLLDRFEPELREDALVRTAATLRGQRAAGASVAALAQLVPGVGLGPLSALRREGWRERTALRLVDPERVALLGEAGYTKRASVLSRMLLDPSLLSTLSFLRRKRALRRARRRAESGAPVPS